MKTVYFNGPQEMDHYMLLPGDIISIAGYNGPLYVVDVEPKENATLIRCTYSESAYWDVYYGNADPGLSIILENGIFPLVVGRLKADD